MFSDVPFKGFRHKAGKAEPLISAKTHTFLTTAKITVCGISLTPCGLLSNRGYPCCRVLCPTLPQSVRAGKLFSDPTARGRSMGSYRADGE